MLTSTFPTFLLDEREISKSRKQIKIKKKEISILRF